MDGCRDWACRSAIHRGSEWPERNRWDAAPTRALRTCIAHWLLMVPLLTSFCVHAQRIDRAYADRYHELIEELRCLVCQNESLAESNADLAKDLRSEILQMMERGASNEQIIDFLVARYGDFVLYRPPFKPITYVLWVAPFGVAIIGLVTLIYGIRRRGRDADSPLSPQEQSRLSELLDDRPRD